MQWMDVGVGWIAQLAEWNWQAGSESFAGTRAAGVAMVIENGSLFIFCPLLENTLPVREQGRNRGMKMNQIDNNQISGTKLAQADPSWQAAKPAPRPGGTFGEVSPSDRAIIGKLAARLHELPPARMELIRQVRQEIAAGTYETPHRLEKTAEKLAEELFQNYIGS